MPITSSRTALAVAMWNRQLLRSGTLPIAAVFLLGLCLAAGAAWWWQNDIERDAETQFQHSPRVMFDISRRFRQAVYGLKGAREAEASSLRDNKAAEGLNHPRAFHLLRVALGAMSVSRLRRRRGFRRTTRSSA
jgi:hypothetical protein